MNGVDALAPRDGDFGGTWIGVNQYGMVAALLNRYEDAPGEAADGASPISRGLLLQSVLDGPTAESVAVRLQTLTLDRYRPFTIASFDRAGQVRLSDWSGTAITVTGHEAFGLVRTSSGRDQKLAESHREAAYQTLIGDRSPSAEQLRKFHESHLPEQGPFSVCMHREEAQTQSLTEIRVTARTATMKYWAGSPCLAAGALVRRIPVIEVQSAP